MLLIVALFTSYMLQHKKIQAVHETVLSIFAGNASQYPQSLGYQQSTEFVQVWLLGLS